MQDVLVYQVVRLVTTGRLISYFQGNDPVLMN